MATHESAFPVVPWPACRQLGLLGHLPSPATVAAYRTVRTHNPSWVLFTSSVLWKPPSSLNQRVLQSRGNNYKTPSVPLIKHAIRNQSGAQTHRVCPFPSFSTALILAGSFHLYPQSWPKYNPTTKVVRPYNVISQKKSKFGTQCQ